MKKLLVVLTAILLLAFVPFVIATDITQTLTFQWEDTNNPDIMQDWRLYWSEIAGGPYDETPVSIIPYEGTGPTFSSPAEAIVSGIPATHVVKYFVLVACGNTIQADGSTKYECSANSNEIFYDFWIPAGKFSVPVQFKIVVTP